MSQTPPGPAYQLRRIVTKHDKDGKAVVDIDATVPVDHIPEFNVDIGKIWATDVVPSKDNNLDIDGATRPIHGIVSPGGASCLYTDLGPSTTIPMHRTTSVDLNILVSGEVILIMENGEEYHLKNPGDTVVQRGTIHAWRNPLDTWTRWVTVVIDAEPTIGVNSERLPDVV